MIRPLKSKDLTNFVYSCQYRDPCSDFYITKDNKRLYLTNIPIAKTVFNDCMKHGEKCFIKEENGHIQALLLITGYKEHVERKYVKVLVRNKKDFKDLFNYIQWQKMPNNLFIKVKKTNQNFVTIDERTNHVKLSYFVRKAGFRIIAVREKEVLLKKEEYKREYRKYNNKRN